MLACPAGEPDLKRRKTAQKKSELASAGVASMDTSTMQMSFSDRARAAVLGAHIGDALAFPFHWYYSYDILQKHMDQYYKQDSNGWVHGFQKVCRQISVPSFTVDVLRFMASSSSNIPTLSSNYAACAFSAFELPNPNCRFQILPVGQLLESIEHRSRSRQVQRQPHSLGHKRNPLPPQLTVSTCSMCRLLYQFGKMSQHQTSTHVELPHILSLHNKGLERPLSPFSCAAC